MSGCIVSFTESITESALTISQLTLPDCLTFGSVKVSTPSCLVAVHVPVLKWTEYECMYTLLETEESISEAGVTASVSASMSASAAASERQCLGFSVSPKCLNWLEGEI